jgi:hypothetical protein
MTTCNVVSTPFDVYDSKWVCAHLPIQYALESDLFPDNLVDNIDTIISITQDEFGFAVVELAGTYETYQEKLAVKITNSGISGYNGVWRIREVTYPDVLVLDMPFLGDATAELQKYYANYNVLVKVYMGIPVGHFYYSENPITLITENPLSYKPNPQNIAYVEISSIIKSYFSDIENDFCGQLETGIENAINDRKDWIAFYVSFAESYDAIIDDELGTYISPYQFDLDGAGESQLFTDINFASGIASYTQYNAYGSMVFPDSWVGGVNEATSNRISGLTKRLGQYITVENGKTYNISATVILTTNSYIYFYFGNTLIDNNFLSAGTHTIDFTWQATESINDILSIEGLSTEDITITEFSVMASNADLNIYYASNSVQQFQYQFGNNMGEYVLNDNELVLPTKFLTTFEQPVLFEGYEFDLSFILPSDLLGLFDTLELKWRELDQNKNSISDWDYSDIENLDAGVYRFLLNTLPYSTNAFYLEVEIVYSDYQTTISETKTIKISKSDCGKNPVFLKWLNYLGGWDCWLFTRHKDTKVDFGEVESFRRNIYNIWDNDFVNGTTQDDFISIQSKNSFTIRSQYLSLSEIKAVSEIKRSIKVQEIKKAETFAPYECIAQNKRTWLVEKSNFTVFSDSTKLYEISFDITDTADYLTQRQ